MARHALAIKVRVGGCWRVLAGDGAPDRAKADGAVGAADGLVLSENGVIVYVLL